MKITPSPQKQPTGDTRNVSHGNRVAHDTYTAISHPASSQVDLSSTARQLQNLHSTGDDLNLEKIQSLKDAIASGKLQVDTSRIADALIVSTLELLK